MDTKDPKDLEAKEALKWFLQRIPFETTAIEEISIENAVGRVVAEEVTATMDDPPYSTATADGYVLLSPGTALASPTKPVTFKIMGNIPPPSQAMELPAGQTFTVKAGNYMAIKRFLEGYYTVLQKEGAFAENNQLRVPCRLEKGVNLSLQGSVRKAGNIIVGKGHKIQTRDIFMLANQGILSIKVVNVSPPKVVLFSVGDDLIIPTESYKINFKYDGNAYGLPAMVKAAGGIPFWDGIVSPKLPLLIPKVVQALEDANLVIIAGTVGISFMVELIQTIAVMDLTDADEKTIHFAKQAAIVFLEKTRPTVLGLIKGKPVICLLRESEQAEKGFDLFVGPVISHLLGEVVPTVPATAMKK